MLESKGINKVRMAGRALISSGFFLIPQGEVCEINLEVNSDATGEERTLNFPIRIAFKDDGDTEQSVSFKPDQDNSSVKMTLHNWNSPLGSVLKEFYPIVNIENKTKVEMFMLNRRVGEVNELLIQFWKKDI